MQSSTFTKASTPTKDSLPAHSEVRTIDSVRDPATRRIADVLHNRSGKPKIIVIDDAENIAGALASGIRLDSVYLTRAAAVNQGARGASTHIGDDVPRYLIDDRVAAELFGAQKHARVFALAHAPRPEKLSDLRGTRGDLLVLDGVRLVGNIGAITRTACALGTAGIILLDSGLNTTFDRRLIRASRGLVFSLPIVITSRAECAAFLRRERISIATLSADAANPLSAIRSVANRVALVLGGERHGVSPELDALASHRYSIPMMPGVESLNVSVAAGIALYAHGAR